MKRRQPANVDHPVVDLTDVDDEILEEADREDQEQATAAGDPLSGAELTWQSAMRRWLQVRMAQDPAEGPVRLGEQQYVDAANEDNDRRARTEAVKQRRAAELQRRMDQTLRAPKNRSVQTRREATVDTISTDGPITITEETARQMNAAGIAIDPARYRLAPVTQGPLRATRMRPAHVEEPTGTTTTAPPLTGLQTLHQQARSPVQPTTTTEVDQPQTHRRSLTWRPLPIPLPPISPRRPTPLNTRNHPFIGRDSPEPRPQQNTPTAQPTTLEDLWQGLKKKLEDESAVRSAAMRTANLRRRGLLNVDEPMRDAPTPAMPHESNEPMNEEAGIPVNEPGDVDKPMEDAPQPNAMMAKPVQDTDETMEDAPEPTAMMAKPDQDMEETTAAEVPLQRTMLEDGRSVLIEEDRMFLFAPRSTTTTVMPQTMETTTHQENEDDVTGIPQTMDSTHQENECNSQRSVSMEISEAEAELDTENPLLDMLDRMIDDQMTDEP
ncbi:hypothetical protein LTS03_003034 [Exophiala xenobiotica]|nr:hypothetical protein LTR11_002794 [Exophiala xenobiotica]KAK5385069.1 hypothetical protein LTS03_003034 [Exophiala xenobiotica]